MQYTKVIFTVTPDNETNREILTAYLSLVDFDMFDETENELNAFIPSDRIKPEELGNMLSELPFHANFRTEVMPDINWNKEWEKNYFQPLLIGNQCLIRAPFHKDYPESKYEIIIEPNMAFGTGNHETTTLMIEHLLDLDIRDQVVLDMGCGTGILGIMASKLGCREVTAIDVDSWAFESTIENSRINNVSNIKAFIGDTSLLVNRQFDVILANIQRNIILSDMERYCSVLKDDGILIVSGFYKNDLEEIAARASELFLRKRMIREQNNWVACSFTK